MIHFTDINVAVHFPLVKTIAGHVFLYNSLGLKTDILVLRLLTTFSPFTYEKVKTRRKACRGKLARVESALTETSVYRIRLKYKVEMKNLRSKVFDH